MRKEGESQLAIDYLIIGNVTRDLLSDGSFTIGGTVTYASRTALALGRRVGVVTSADPDLDLEPVLSGVELARKFAANTLTFENVYSPSGRVQFLHALGAPLGLEAVPLEWRQPDIVHLAPLAGECDPALVDTFPGAFVGVTPQGWMRSWDDERRVRASEWTGAADLLPRVDAAVMSVHDVGGDEAMLARFAKWAPVLVVTMGPRGCRVYVGRDEHYVPVRAMPETDPTGAGDIFAAAFFVCMQQNGDPLSAADFANRVASLSVKRVGWASTPRPEEVEDITCARSFISAPLSRV